MCSLRDKLQADEKLDVYKTFASFVLAIVKNFFCLVILLDSSDAPKTKIKPSGPPSQLRRLTPRAFYDIIKEQRKWLSVTFSEEKINE